MNETETLEFWSLFVGYHGGGCRKGQAMMNALYRVAPELYDEIHGTDADCFYVDELIDNFRKTVGV